MPVTRRSFLRAGALTALSAGFLINSAGFALAQTSDSPGDFAAPYEAKTDPVFYFKKATFDPYLNTTFRASARGSVVELVLVKITDTCSPARSTLTKKARPTQGFTLLFRASAPLSGITTIHTLSHDALGKFSLFLVRASDENDRVLYYEAVINHA
jgi:hypothetical protein